MDSLKTQDLAPLIGIYAPWQISSVDVITEHQSITLVLEKSEKKSRFGFLSSTKKDQKARKWQHIRFGHFNTYIQTNLSTDDIREMHDSGQVPAFLGSEGKEITRELSDLIRRAHSRGLSSEAITGLLGLKMELVEREIHEIESEDQSKRSVALLPLESDPIWKAVLTDQVKLSTRLLPLKFLLSRLKLEVSKNLDNADVMQQSVSELRNFFVRHVYQLRGEYEQLGVNNTNAAPAAAPAKKSALILPGTKNHVWQLLLGGQLELKTASMALKLALSQHRRAYGVAKQETEKLDAIRKIRLFFKHNARSLIPELTTLTQMVNDQKNHNTLNLPPVNHEIWKKLLLDDKLLSTEKINYRLLLSKLKVNYRREQDTSSIEQLHQFFNANASAMTEEIKKINSLAAAY